MTTTSETSTVYSQIYTPAAYKAASTSFKIGYDGLRSAYNTNPDELTVNEIAFLRARSEDAIRNNPTARSLFDNFVKSLGTIKVNWKLPDGQKAEKTQNIWNTFAKDCNFDGYGDFNTHQVVKSREIFQNGTAFTRKRIVTGEKGTVPLKLEQISANLHDMFFFNTDKGRKIQYGIEFEEWGGKPVNYFFRENVTRLQRLTTTFDHVTFSAKELIHSFFRDSATQWIGTPLLTTSLIALYELDKLTDVTIAKQQAAQAISWIVKNTNPLNATPVGAMKMETIEGENKVVFNSFGGSVQYLNKNEDIAFYQSTDIGANLPVLIKNETMRICASLNIPYFAGTGDYSDLDYSSIRALGIELRTRMLFLYHTYLLPTDFDNLTTSFKSLVLLSNKGTEFVEAQPFYQLPRFYGVDELKDTQADLLEVQSGMATLQSKLDERHTTFEEVLEDAKRNEKLKKYGIDLYKSKEAAGQNKNIEANTNSTGI